MSEWGMTTVGEVAEIFDGPHATPTKTEAGPWFLSISSLKQGQLDLSESAHLSGEDFRKWTRRVTPREGDVLFSYETRLGEAALMPAGIQACLGRRMGLLRPKANRADSRFLLYSYLGPDFQQVIRERSIHGATVDRIPLVELPGWPIRLPELWEQRAIAELLGALDDKIAVNDRVAQNTLELAVARYVEAVNTGEFTHFVSMGDSARWLSGGTPDTTEETYWGGEIPWISALSLKSPWVDDSDRRVTHLGAASGTRLVPKDTILFVVRGSSLDTEFRVGLTQREVAFGQDCKALIANTDIDPTVLFLAIKARSAEILQLVDHTGHGAGRLSTDLISKVVLALPDARLSSKAAAELRPLVEIGAARRAENRNLQQLRDALLPKLMSGEIRVRDAEKVVEKVT
jgi:type I restriction enzyme S subunit